MHANLKGAFNQLDKSWKAFTHKGKPMTKKEVNFVLEYGIAKGYETTKDFTDQEVDQVLSTIK
jgi:hypothetical protein